MTQTFKPSSSMIAAFLLLSVTSPLGQGQVPPPGIEKIDGKIDLVMILPNYASPTVGDSWKNATLQYLPHYFEMGEQKTRIAVIDVGNYAEKDEGKRVALNLTGDRTTFEKVLQAWTIPRLGNVQYPHKAFEAARKRVFDFGNSDRAKVVICVKYGAVGARPNAYDEAVQLRNKGVSIYVINHDYREDAVNYTGGHSAKVIQEDDPKKFHEDASILLFLLVNPVIFPDLCGWEQTCRYPDASRSQCESKTFRPKISVGHNTDPNKTCDKTKPRDRTCAAADDCVKECDKRWEWSEPNCSVTCGVIKRKTATPPEQMENCPPEMQCQLCTTTTTPTTPTTTTTTTTATTSTTTTTTTTTPATSTVTTPEPGMESWKIGVIVAAIIILLLVIALIAFLVVRKNRAAAAAQAAEAMKKKMAMEAASKSMVKGEVATGWAPVVKGAQEASIAADISVAGVAGRASMISGGKSMGSKRPGG